MVQILPQREGFGAKLGAGVGQGVSHGMSQLAEHASKLALEQQKMQQRLNLIQQIEGEGLTPRNKGSDLAGQIPGKSFQDQINKKIQPEMEEDPFRKAELYATIGEHDLSNVAAKRAESQIKSKQKSEEFERKKFESDREFHTKTSEPILKEARKILQEAPIKQGLYQQQIRDVESGNTAGIIPFLVETTGAEFWRNPESARFKNAAKHRFIEGLNSIGGGARPNQFLEKQLSGAQATIGQSPESALTVIEMEKFIDDMKEQRARFELQLANEDQEKYGYARNDISERADDIMRDYAQKRQIQMAQNIQKRHEDSLNDEQLTHEVFGKGVAKGTPLTPRMARILMLKNGDNANKAYAESLKLGFEVPE